MVKEPGAVTRQHATKRLGVFALCAIGGALAMALAVIDLRERSDTDELADVAAPASLQARLLDLEAASEALARELARARRELSDL